MNTVNTHTRHLYAKLGVHGRREAVDRARALGLLAPPPEELRQDQMMAAHRDGHPSDYG